MTNTKEQAIALATKATESLDKKRREFEFTFFDNTKINVRVLNINSTIIENGFSCSIITFTTDINKTTTYNIYDIKDIN